MPTKQDNTKIKNKHLQHLLNPIALSWVYTAFLYKPAELSLSHSSVPGYVCCLVMLYWMTIHFLTYPIPCSFLTNSKYGKIRLYYTCTDIDLYLLFRLVQGSSDSGPWAGYNTLPTHLPCELHSAAQEQRQTPLCSPSSHAGQPLPGSTDPAYLAPWFTDICICDMWVSWCTEGLCTSSWAEW